MPFIAPASAPPPSSPPLPPPQLPYTLSPPFITPIHLTLSLYRHIISTSTIFTRPLPPPFQCPLTAAFASFCYFMSSFITYLYFPPSLYSPSRRFAFLRLPNLTFHLTFLFFSHAPSPSPPSVPLINTSSPLSPFP